MSAASTSTLQLPLNDDHILVALRGAAKRPDGRKAKIWLTPKLAADLKK